MTITVGKHINGSDPDNRRCAFFNNGHDHSYAEERTRLNSTSHVVRVIITEQNHTNGGTSGES